LSKTIIIISAGLFGDLFGDLFGGLAELLFSSS
jgi:hypothetical protein